MSYEYFEPRRKGCTPFGCGWTFLVVGVALALLGWFWNYPQVTYARGIVVESRPLRPPSMWRSLLRTQKRVAAQPTVLSSRYSGSGFSWWQYAV